MNAGTLTLAGSLVTRKVGCPKAPVLWRVRNWLMYRLPDYPRLAIAAFAAACGVATFQGRLYIRVHRADGRWEDYGLVSTRVVTTAGVGFIVDAFQNIVELENMKYHAAGTSSAAEATTDIAPTTELTTQYATDNTRPTGTTTEGATANIYRSVGTVTVDATVTITEHALMAAATGAAACLDRSIFTGIPLVSGEGIQFTYELTCTAGG